MTKLNFQFSISNKTKITFLISRWTEFLSIWVWIFCQKETNSVQSQKKCWISYFSFLQKLHKSESTIPIWASNLLTAKYLCNILNWKYLSLVDIQDRKGLEKISFQLRPHSSKYIAHFISQTSVLNFWTCMPWTNLQTFFVFKSFRMSFSWNVL